MDMQSPKRRALVDALTSISDDKRKLLDDYKADGNKSQSRTDFLWHFLLQSFATMGNSRGWDGLIGNMENYNRIRYDAISNLSDDELAERFDSTLRAAKVRMPSRKAKWLYSNFKRIQAKGGLEAANREAFDAPGRKAKLEFLTQFDGIGPKYARNIWMDVYHPDFHNSIAIDDRIKKISTALGVEFRRYDEHEKFYLDIAKDANLNGWELDRLLYNFRDHFLQVIESA